jgi:hypothetical protein
VQSLLCWLGLRGWAGLGWLASWLGGWLAAAGSGAAELAKHRLGWLGWLGWLG